MKKKKKTKPEPKQQQQNQNQPYEQMLENPGCSSRQVALGFPLPSRA